VTAAKSHISNHYTAKADGLDLLNKEFPRSLSVEELYKSNLNPELPAKVMELTMLDLIELRDSPCPMLSSANSLKSLSPLVKTLIQFGNVVPNLRSDAVALSPSIHTALRSKTNLSEVQLTELCSLGLMLG
jgi:hypothetical protein